MEIAAKKVMIPGNWESIKDKLFLSVCPTKEAKKTEGLLYESIGPLALVPRVLISTEGDRVESEVFLESAVRALNIPPEDIIAQAKKNGENLFHTVIVDALPTFIITSFINNDPNKGLYNPYGGAQIFYEGKLDFFRKKLEKDFFILPFSRLEMFIVPAEEYFEPADLLDMVKESNSEYPEETNLGDFVLLYRDGKVSVAAEA